MKWMKITEISLSTLDLEHRPRVLRVRTRHVCWHMALQNTRPRESLNSLNLRFGLWDDRRWSHIISYHIIASYCLYFCMNSIWNTRVELSASFRIPFTNCAGRCATRSGKELIRGGSKNSKNRAAGRMKPMRQYLSYTKVISNGLSPATYNTSLAWEAEEQHVLPMFEVTRILTSLEALSCLLSCYMGGVGWGGVRWVNNVHVYLHTQKIG